MPDLVVDHLGVRLGTNEVLKDVSFQAAPGEIVALLGPSGSGKTTLLRCVAGLERPHKRRIAIGERVLIDADRKVELPPERRGIGLVFQSYALWPHKTVAENVAYGLKLRRVPTAEQKTRVADTLERLGLGLLGERYPYQLSGGQQQRVAICRALVYQPEALLMDEPLSNLDAKLREEARYWIRKLILDLGMCCVIVTHDQSEALAMSDNVILLQNGTIVQEGSPQELYGHPASLYAATFLGANNVLSGALSTDGSTISGEGWSLRGTRQGQQAATNGAGTGVIRVERIAVRDAAGPDRVQMQVDGNVFLGDRWEYHLARGTLKVVAHGPGPLEQSEVWCEIPPRDLWLFAEA